VQPGDVLLAINGKPVQGVEQVRDGAAPAPEARGAAGLARDGQQMFVPVALG
jgi:serine protease Do